MKNQKMLIGFLAALLVALLVTPGVEAGQYSIGGGIGVKPDYEGSSDYELVPVPTGAASILSSMGVWQWSSEYCPACRSPWPKGCLHKRRPIAATFGFPMAAPPMTASRMCMAWP